MKQEIDGKTYYSVGDFAKIAGVTTQAVYARLNNDEDELQGYLKVIGKTKTIEDKAVSLFKKKPQPKQVDIQELEAQNQIANLTVKLEAAQRRADDLEAHYKELVQEKDSVIELLKADKESLRSDNAQMQARLDSLLKQVEGMTLIVAQSRPPVLDGKIKDAQPEPEPRPWWKRLFS